MFVACIWHATGPVIPVINQRAVGDESEVYWNEFWMTEMGERRGGVLGFAFSTVAVEVVQIVRKYSYPSVTVHLGAAELLRQRQIGASIAC